MKRQLFCMALIVATSMTMTSCLDKILNKAARNNAAEYVDDEDEDEGDDLSRGRNRHADRDDLDDLSSRRRQSSDLDEDEYEDEYYIDDDDLEPQPLSDDDNEVEKLLRRLADRNDLEIRGMDVVDIIDEVLSSRRLRESDLVGMDSEELSLLRNAIYARNGYRFSRDDLFNYFNNFSWYYPVTSNMTEAYNNMSATERYNVDFIRRHE